MTEKRHTTIDFGPEMFEFGREVARAVHDTWQQMYGGVNLGGHGPMDHHGGYHAQVTIVTPRESNPREQVDLRFFYGDTSGDGGAP